MNEIKVEAISVHFGNDYWVNNLIKQLEQINIIEKIHIVSKEKITLKIKSTKTEIHHINSKSLQHASFDHADSINYLKMLNYKSEYVLLLDTDIVGLNDRTFSQLPIHDNKMSYLAVDPKNRFNTHPCFMLIPTRIFTKLDFNPKILQYLENRGTKEQLIDTGREIGRQIISSGEKVYLLHSRKRYRFINWDYYWEVDLLHLGSRSFPENNTPIRMLMKFYEDVVLKRILTKNRDKSLKK